MRVSAKIRREQLVEVAMKLFSQQGFDGTTTREIAEAAGVNEAIIFRHFRTKEELYWEVVSSRIKAAGRQRKIREYLDSNLGQEELLTAIAESLLNRTREDADFTRLLLFSALRNCELSDRFFHTYMAETYEMLAEYLRKGISAGRFRKVNPLIAARGFLGMVSNHIMVQELFGGSHLKELKPHVVSRQLADIWLNGVSARSELPTNGNHRNAALAVVSGNEKARANTQV